MNMQQVITSEQAKRITKGRTPLVPVEYETAVKALAECITLDETKYWSDKADALAAWAKIYRSPDVMLKAKRLKLHAYRRMGEIAGELRPRKLRRGNGEGTGAYPGPVSLLIDQGLTRTQAQAARRVASLPERQFNKEMKEPRAPSTVAYSMLKVNPTWQMLSHYGMSLRAWCRSNDAKEAARKLDDKQIETARQMATDLTEWFDDFERALRKVKS